VDIQFSTEYRIRLAAAAEEREMSVEEFVLDAIERALRPIENRRLGAARDVLELEALWRSAEESSRNEENDKGRSS
jgi:uncharacterized protein (DUF1778 family)